MNRWMQSLLVGAWALSIVAGLGWAACTGMMSVRPDDGTHISAEDP